MTKVMIHGCNGRMGQMISSLVREDEEIEVAAGVDPYTGIQNDYPVFQRIEECTAEVEVVIDFASAAAADDLLDYCEKRKIPCVLCTTGLSQEQQQRILETAKKTAVLKSANMSLGVNMLLKLLQEAASVLAPAGFDIEIVEKHHNLKIDAPSGTALAMAEVMNETLENKYNYRYDRSGDKKKREKYEIGISAVRGGTITGDHDVIFAGIDEVVTFSHQAYSKAIFGKGAIQAAKFLKGKPAGLYEMSDVINAG